MCLGSPPLLYDSGITLDTEENYNILKLIRLCVKSLIPYLLQRGNDYTAASWTRNSIETSYIQMLVQIGLIVLSLTLRGN
jgi:hypothetical protein